MKFLCDRCKTRYSIGDERVRGKILKIRCKNCANVITVREGMSADEPDRRLRPTTGAPMAAASAPAGSALASAFVAQMSTKPPPALEEEWYVSIDGEQSGPFSLAEAQRWIAAKTFDAELHCWSEGFDDWLPVDKVSHFRGLRKKPAPPPALPRVARPPPVPEEEPKPLFAATMATLERSATQPPPMGLPAATSVPTLKSPTGGPTNGVFARANGTGPATAMPRVTPLPRVTPVPKISTPGSGPVRPNTTQGVSAGAKALAAAFDTGDAAGESMTTVDQPAFNDEIQTSAEPIAAKRYDRLDAAIAEAKANGQSRPEPAAPEMPDDDEMMIGEVSRVVKLADIAKMGQPQRKSSRTPVGRQSGASLPLRAGATGSSPKLDPNVLADPMQQPMGDVGTGVIVAPVVAQAHRRGMIMLIGVAAALLIGVAVAVVLIIQNTTDDSGGSLGHIKEYDNSRPEEIVRAHMLPQEGSGATAPTQHHQRFVQHNNGNGNGVDETPGTGTKIKSDEVEDMANKNSAGTQRCYIRAQRGAAGIETADLKRLSVTLTIDKTGAVTDVQFTEKTAEMLLTCLRTQIRLWKFRESPGGMYRIVLAFGSG